MADSNSIRLDDLVPEGVALSRADEAAFYRFARDRAEGLLRGQVAKGIGADGKKLPKVKRSSRPDGATGAPLDPHRSDSRTMKWLRSAAAKSRRGVTLWWSHGWGRILDAHRRGRGRYGAVPVRDAMGLSPANERKFRRDCARWLKGRTSPRRRAERSAEAAIAKAPKAARELAAAKPYLRDYLVAPSYTPRARRAGR